ncbi:MAG: hypothetical protein Q8N60_01900 [Candidatus Diapherotrites archaeon]|nr:hypothetical protein [Candidatus Diapherotrites archaeon]
MAKKNSNQYRRIRQCKNCGHVWRSKIGGYKVKCPHCGTPAKR